MKKTTHNSHYILNMLILLGALFIGSSCTDEEALIPSSTERAEGETPLSVKPVKTITRSENSSEAHEIYDNIVLHGTAYDMYCCAVLYKAFICNGYYTWNPDTKTFFQPMKYDATDNIMFSERYFYPTNGYIDLFSFGVEEGRTITPGVYPQELKRNESAQYIFLDLTTRDKNKNFTYDGSFDIIVADRMTKLCSTEFYVENLPFAHFRHIMANISVSVKWTSPSAGNSLHDRILINSVRLEKSRSQGIFYLYQDAANGTWSERDSDIPEAELANTSADKRLSPTSGLNLGNKYIIPQAKRQRLIVNYTIRNGIAGNYTDRTVNYCLEDPNPDDGWLAGHKYTYSISIGEFGTANITGIEVEEVREGDTGDTEIL